jgi:hypothetical protein
MSTQLEKFACGYCKEGVATAPAPEQVLEIHLSCERLEQERELPRVDPLRARMEMHPAQLGDQQLEIGVSGQHRLSSGLERRIRA